MRSLYALVHGRNKSIHLTVFMKIKEFTYEKCLPLRTFMVITLRHFPRVFLLIHLKLIFKYPFNICLISRIISLQSFHIMTTVDAARIIVYLKYLLTGLHHKLSAPQSILHTMAYMESSKIHIWFCPP